MKSDCLFFPGLGADHRLFTEQKKFFKDRMACPALLAPSDPELNLTDYTKSQVDHWRVQFPNARYLVGMSFGGMIALELALFWPEIKGVALISAIRSAEELTSEFKRQAQFGRFVPESMIRFFMNQTMIPKLIRSEQLGEQHASLLIEMANDVDFKFFRWSTRAAAGWQQNWDHYPKRNELSVLQIHGKKDGIIPVQRTENVSWISEGGHLIQWTHADQVNQKLADWMESLS